MTPDHIIRTKRTPLVVSDQPEQGGRKLFRFDTSLRGNSNMGHDGIEFGTELRPADKDALVEYLKSF